MDLEPNPLAYFGYSAREARWLRLVLVHCGVFLRRQYLAFIGHAAAGAIDQRLLARLLAERHAVAFPYQRCERAYHVRARALYAAIGHAHSRHRRAMPAVTLAHRLLALDFLIQEPGPYLEGERATVDTFLNWNLHPDVLPVRVYAPRRSAGYPTRRFFIEQYPIAVLPSQTVRFVVPDLAPQSAAALRHFLTHYARLVRALSQVEIVYVTARERSATVAERLFRRAFGPANEEETFGDLCCALALHEVVSRDGAGSLDDVSWTHYHAWRRTVATADFDALSDAWRGRQPDVVRAYIRRDPFVGPRRFRHVAMPWRYALHGPEPRPARGRPRTRHRNAREKGGPSAGSPPGSP